MKKSYLVLTAVVLCLAILLCGCALTVDKVKKDPNVQVANAIKNTAEQLAKEIPVSLPSGLDKKGTLSAKMSDTLTESGEMNASVMWNGESNSAAANIKSDMIGEIGLYFKGNEIALKADALKDGTAYGANLETLLEDLKDSELFGVLGITYDDVKAYIEKYVNEILNSKKGNMLEERMKAVGDVLKSCEVDVAKESITTGGKSADAICVTYKLTKEDYLALTEAFNPGLDDELIEEGKEAELSGTVKFAINPDEKVIMQISLDIAVTEDSDTENATLTLDLGKNPSKSEEFTLLIADDDIDKKVVYDRRDKDGKFCRKISVDYSVDEFVVDEFVYDKKSGEYVLTIDGDKTDGGSSYTGKLQSADGKLTFTLDSYEERWCDEWGENKSDKTDVGIELTLTNSAEVPDMPEYKNIARLSADEYSEIATMISSLMYSGYGDSNIGDDDYSYMYEYDPTHDYDGDGDVDGDDREFFDDYYAA